MRTAILLSALLALLLPTAPASADTLDETLARAGLAPTCSPARSSASTG